MCRIPTAGALRQELGKIVAGEATMPRMKQFMMTRTVVAVVAAQTDNLLPVITGPLKL